MVDDDILELPLTQDDLADATGLTPVHINRTLQRLREAGLIVIGSRMFKVLDVRALKEAGGFDDSYLHFQRRARNIELMAG